MNYNDFDVFYMCIYEFCYFYFECDYLMDKMVIMWEYFWFVEDDDELYYLINIEVDCVLLVIYWVRVKFEIVLLKVLFGGWLGIY